LRYLPFLRELFGITVLDQKLVALKQTSNNEKLHLLFKKYPYIISINAVNIKVLIDIYNYRDKKALKDIKLSRGANTI